MKPTNKIVITILTVLFAFSATVYNSCKKDPCKGVTCANGGVCNGGLCKCPSGYSGPSCQTKDPSTLVYQNNTFTPINITVNGISSVIPVGGSVLYKGFPGGSASGNAYTSGIKNSGTPIGLTLSWAVSDVFPAANTTFTRYLNVSASYYFLRVINNSPYYILQEYMDYMLPTQTVDSYVIYNIFGKINSLGYRNAASYSNIYLTTTDPIWNYYTAPVLPFTQNQSYTDTVN